MASNWTISPETYEDLGNVTTKAFFIFGLCLAALSLAAFYQLLGLQFERGNVYASHSSYRSDPRGTRALYEALEAVPGMAVSRNLQPIGDAQFPPGSTVIIAGAATSDDPKYIVEAIERVALNSGRVVIAFHFVSALENPFVAEDDPEVEEEEEEEDPPTPPRDHSLAPISIEARWNFKYLRSPLAQTEGRVELHAERIGDDEALPLSISWHSDLGFGELGPEWRTVYSSHGEAVIIERSWGQGTLVLLGDSYLLTNEAMRSERHPALLAWLLGSSNKVVFDETHLGTVERLGVASLIRRYRLEGLLIAMALTLALVVWRNSASLVPKREADEATRYQVLRERDLASGLTNLLRQSVPQSNIVDVCLNEWRRTFKRNLGQTADFVRHLQILAEGRISGGHHGDKPHSRYSAIHKALEGTKTRRHTH